MAGMSGWAILAMILTAAAVLLAVRGPTGRLDAVRGRNRDGGAFGRADRGRTDPALPGHGVAGPDQRVDVDQGAGEGSVRGRPGRWSTWVGRLLAGRPGAVPLRSRVLAGAAVLAAVALLTLRRLPDLGPAVVLPAVVAGAAVTVGAGWLETGAARRRRSRLIKDLPQALSLLGATVGAGLPLRTATRAVAAASAGPVAEDLGRVLAAIDLGRPEGEAWRGLRTDPVWAPVATEVARSVESGTRLAEDLLRHAEQARERRRAAIEVIARGVGVRSVLPLMACFVPAFLLIGIVPTIASALLRILS